MRVLVIQPDGITGTSGPARLIASLLAEDRKLEISQIVTLDVEPSDEVATFIAQSRAGSASLTDFLTGRSISIRSVLSFRENEDLRQFLGATNPDVCLLHPGNLFSLLLARHLHRAHGIPLVTHTMDDHYNTWPNAASDKPWKKAVVTRLIGRRYQRVLREIYGLASKNFSISAVMAEEYSAEFESEFAVLRPPAKIPSAGTQTQNEQTGDLTVVYAGSLRPGTNRSAVAEVSEELLEGELHVYSFDEPLSEAGTRTVSHSGVSTDELPELLERHNFGLIALDLTPENATFVRLSWPSKLSDYLAIGLTPIFYGPPCEASRVIVEEGLGVVATSRPQLRQLLGRLTSEMQRADAAQVFAREHLSLEKARRLIVEALLDACNEEAND